MRLLCVIALTLSFGLWLGFAHAKKLDEKTDRAAKLADLKKKYEATCKELAVRLSKERANFSGIEFEIREETALMASRVLPIAQADPKDDIAFDAASYIVQAAGKKVVASLPTSLGKDDPNLRIYGEDLVKAVAILAEHHTTNAKVKDCLWPAMFIGTAGETLLKAVSEKATDKTAKGTALYLLGSKFSLSIADEDNEKKVAAQAQEGIELLEQATKLAPDATINNSNGTTIAKLAARGIEELKDITSLFPGKPAPDVESKLLDGTKIKLSSYKGKVVLLDIWATWCGPCREMIPHERDLVKKMKDKPFVLVSVSADREVERLQKFLEKEEMPWTHWWDHGPESSVLKKYRIKAYPTMYVIDHTGVIRHKWVGNPGNDTIDAAIEELVKTAEKAKG